MVILSSAQRPDEAFAALQHGVVHSADVQAFGGEQLERAVLALEIDRADVGDHDAGDLAHDLVEPHLPVVGFAHDIAQAPHDDTQRRLGRHHTGLVASSRNHGLQPFNRSALSGGYTAIHAPVRNYGLETVVPRPACLGKLGTLTPRRGRKGYEVSGWRARHRRRRSRR